MIKSLKSSFWKRIWYVDDASCCGILVCVQQWFDLVLQHGPKFGYFPNLSKSSLHVHPNLISIAEHKFGCLGVKIVCDHRTGVGYLDNVPSRSSFVLQKVTEGVTGVRCSLELQYINIRLHLLLQLNHYSMSGHVFSI